MAGYARLSNNYWQDKDVLKLRRRNPAAALLHVLAISWCSDHTSDGRIDEDTLLYVLGASETDVTDLVASGMLQADPNGGEGMYVLRSYLKYQNSAEQIEDAKAKATERQRRKRERDTNKTVTDTGNQSVTPMSSERPEHVTPMSRRDNQSVTPMSFNQEPRKNNQEINPPLTPPTEGAATEETEPSIAPTSSLRVSPRSRPRIRSTATGSARSTPTPGRSSTGPCHPSSRPPPRRSRKPAKTRANPRGSSLNPRTGSPTANGATTRPDRHARNHPRRHGSAVTCSNMCPRIRSSRPAAGSWRSSVRASRRKPRSNRCSRNSTREVTRGHEPRGGMATPVRAVLPEPEFPPGALPT